MKIAIDEQDDMLTIVLSDSEVVQTVQCPPGALLGYDDTGKYDAGGNVLSMGITDASYYSQDEGRTSRGQHRPC